MQGGPTPRRQAGAARLAGAAQPVTWGNLICVLSEDLFWADFGEPVICMLSEDVI